jgi:hypothetical protein
MSSSAMPRGRDEQLFPIGAVPTTGHLPLWPGQVGFTVADALSKPSRCKHFLATRRRESPGRQEGFDRAPGCYIPAGVEEMTSASTARRIGSAKVGHAAMTRDRSGSGIAAPESGVMTEVVVDAAVERYCFPPPEPKVTGSTPVGHTPPILLNPCQPQRFVRFPHDPHNRTRFLARTRSSPPLLGGWYVRGASTVGPGHSERGRFVRRRRCPGRGRRPRPKEAAA